MSQTDLARKLKALHIPARPLIIPTIWDIASLHAVASLNNPDSEKQNSSDKDPVKAVATSSWAVAASLGVQDHDLTWEQYLGVIKGLGAASRPLGIPLSIDLQDGYGSRIEEVITSTIEAGAVGGNIEDSIPSANYAGGIQGALYGLGEQVERLKLALRAASDSGLPDFVLNARSDIFLLADHPSLTDEVRLEEAIKRGRAFLEAGATIVYYPAAAERGLFASQIESLVKGLDGKVAVIAHHKPGGFSTKELGQLGVARIQFGASLFLLAREATREAARRGLEGQTLQ